MGDAVRNVAEAGVEHVRRDVAALVARVGIDADAGHAVGERQFLARGEGEFVGSPFACIEPHPAQQEVRGARLCRLADEGMHGLCRIAAGETGTERVRGIDGVRTRHDDAKAGLQRMPPLGIDLPRGAEVGRRNDDEVSRAAGNAGAHKQCKRGRLHGHASPPIPTRASARRRTPRSQPRRSAGRTASARSRSRSRGRACPPCGRRSWGTSRRSR